MSHLQTTNARIFVGMPRLTAKASLALSSVRRLARENCARKFERVAVTVARMPPWFAPKDALLSRRLDRLFDINQGLVYLTMAIVSAIAVQGRYAPDDRGAAHHRGKDVDRIAVVRQVGWTLQVVLVVPPMRRYKHYLYERALRQRPLSLTEVAPQALSHPCRCLLLRLPVNQTRR